MEEFEEVCRRQGLPLTVQRRAVLEELVRRQDHPTADQVFKDVATRLPGVSRTTVYRVLETLVETGIARKVCHPGAAARFEVESHRHHHLVCLRCGRMTDVEDPRLDKLPFPDAGAHGFELTDYSIQFRGTCADCARAVAAAKRAAPARKARGGKKSGRRGVQHETGG
jgi:Fur family peroxide stress response transcriptional regulator